MPHFGSRRHREDQGVRGFIPRYSTASIAAYWESLTKAERCISKKDGHWKDKEQYVTLRSSLGMLLASFVGKTRALHCGRLSSREASRRSMRSVLFQIFQSTWLRVKTMRKSSQGGVEPTRKRRE